MNLVVFDRPEQLREVLPKINLEVDVDDYIHDPEDDDRIVTCPSCSKKIRVNDVGHIMPGSHYIYCKEPICIMDYLERFG